MSVIQFSITLCEPVLVAALEGDPASVVSYDFLPGSTIRGAVIGAYLRRRKQRSLDAGDPMVRRLFFDGSTRFLNGYLQDDAGARSMPTPRSWYRDRRETTTLIYDRLLDGGEDDSGTLWRGVPEPFCMLDGDSATLVAPRRHIGIHTERDRTAGRSRDDSGALYRYDALAPDQTFRAAIVADDEIGEELSTLVLEGDEWVLGGSRGAGYGRVVIGRVEMTPGVWREVTPGRTEPPASLAQGFTVTLLSDAIVRDSRGQNCADLVALGFELFHRLKVDLEPPTAFLASRSVGGFNRAWGLPLPQAHTLRMGSAILFTCRDDVDRGELQEGLCKLEADGIGERLIDGFGRIAVNWQTEPEIRVTRPRGEAREHPPDLTGMPSAPIAQTMLRRMLRAQLDRALVDRANLVAVTNLPSRSQIARLRAVIRDALAEAPADGRPRIKDYLRDLDSRQTTRAQFRGARVGDMHLLEWIAQVVDSPESVWGALRPESQSRRSIGSLRADLGDDAVYEYSLRLIDTVLAHGAKPGNREEEDHG